MHEVSVQSGDELMVVTGGLVLAGVELGSICPGPARTQRAVDHSYASVGFLGEIGDELLDALAIGRSSVEMIREMVD